jgi:hypothetical protein
MNTKKVSVTLLLFTALTAALTAQGLARDMDALLDSGAVTWAEAARFVLPAARVEAADAARAFAEARERGWLPKKAEADGAADFAGVSFLLMKAFDLSGGVLYSLFPGPRYAYRELVYKGILRGPQDRSWKVSGAGLLALIGKTLESGGAE